MKDYYNILKVNKMVSLKDIKKAYIQAIQNYTDKNNLSELEKNQLKDIQKAYYILGDYHNRRKYDDYLEKRLPNNLIIPHTGKGKGIGALNGLAKLFFNYMIKPKFDFNKINSIQSQSSISKINNQCQYEMQTKNICQK